MNIEDTSKDLINSVAKIMSGDRVKEIKEDVEVISESNMDLLKKASDGNAQSIKVKGGKMTMDSFTASAIMSVLKAVKPNVRKNIETVINSGDKTKILQLVNLVLKSTGKKESVKEGAEKDVKGDKEAYQKFFQATLKKFGVKSPDELSGDKEKKFYDAIDAGWKADDEKKEEVSLGEGMKYVNKTTGKDITKHVVDLLSGKIDKKQFEKLVGATPKKESIEEMRQPFIVIDTADDNKVVGTASNEKGAERIISSSERPPISIKDKKSLKVVKSNKKQHVGFPLKEETFDESSNTLWKLTRIHLAVRNAGIKIGQAAQIGDNLKLIFGTKGGYKTEDVALAVKSVMGVDGRGKNESQKVVKELQRLWTRDWIKTGENE